MSGIYQTVMGDRGRLVVPAELRAHAGLDEGVVLVMFELPDGIVLLTQDQLEARVRSDLAGQDLVGELLADRRRAAVEERSA